MTLSILETPSRPPAETVLPSRVVLPHANIFTAPAEGVDLHRYKEKRSLPVSAVYPATEDVSFITKHALTKPQAEAYITDNLAGFLAEYAGKLPYRCLPGYATADKLVVGGFDMLEAARNAVNIKKEHRLDCAREEAELVGLTQIHRALMHTGPDGAQSVAWLSASKIADYGMGFVFTPNKQPPENESSGVVSFQQMLLSYAEPYHSTHTTNGIYQLAAEAAGNPVGHTARSAEDMLRAPLIMNGGLTKEHILQLAQISPQDVSKAQQFEALAQKILRGPIAAYANLVWSVKHAGSLIGHVTQQLQSHVDKIFAMGVRIKQLLDGSLSGADERSLLTMLTGATNASTGALNTATLMHYMNTLATQNIEGGAQCPSWMTGEQATTIMPALISFGYSPMEAFGILQKQGGKIVKNGREYLHCFCPMDGCPSSLKSPRQKVMAPIENGKISCPCCHKSATYTC